MNGMRGIERGVIRSVPPFQGCGKFVGACSRPFRPGYHITGFQPVEATPSPVSPRRIASRLDALAAKQTELRRLQTDTEAALAAFTPPPSSPKPFEVNYERTRPHQSRLSSRVEGPPCDSPA
jgi:hypothetical protein